MTSYQDILSQRLDLIITSATSLSSGDVADIKSNKGYNIFEVYSGNDLDVCRQKIHQIQYLMSDEEQRKPFLLLTDYKPDSFSASSDNSDPNENSIEVLCFCDQMYWLLNGKTAIIDASNDLGPLQAFSLTPIEEILQEGMKNAGIEYEAQVGFGKYTADFVVRMGGTRFLVEADGRAYHNAYKDGKRDEEILRFYDLRTLRLKGSEIFHDVDGCITKIKEFPTHRDFKRSSARMESEDELDASQLKAIRHQFGSARVVAPAGSGKTKVLVNHVADLISRGVSPTEILCLAFNKDAAEQMTQRLGDLGIPCGSASKRSPGVTTVATFNAFGFSILREGAGDLKVLKDKDVESLAISCLQKGSDALGVELMKMRGKKPWIRLIDEMSRIKGGLILPEEATIELSPTRDETEEYPIKPFFEEWQKRCAKTKQITFDDQIYLTASILMSDTKKRRSLQNRFRHIIVDEYQDLNPAQVSLLKMLSPAGQQVFAVGDDDQLIYAWRHVRDRNIAEFEKSFGFAKTYKLSVNYRSSKSVVRVSQRLISHNKNRIEKDIKPGPLNPEGLAVLRINSSIGNQLSSIIKSITRLKKEQTTTGSSVVILTRQNAQQLLVAHALDTAGIPREPLKSTPSLYTTPVAGVLLDYLLVIQSPKDATPEQVCSIINKPNRYLTNVFVEHLGKQKECWRYLRAFSEHASQKPISDQAFKHAFKTNPPGISDNWRNSELLKFIKLIESLNRKYNSSSPSGLIYEVLKHADFRKTQDKEAIDQTEVTDETIIDLVYNEASKFETCDAFVSHFHEKVQYEEKGVKEQESSAHNKEHLVGIRTVHGAKGLEWDNVFLFDIYDKHDTATGNIKGKKKVTISEEDRRVFYVALTRARLNIFVHARPSPMSSFILETFIPTAYKGARDPSSAALMDVRKKEESIRDLEQRRDGLHKQKLKLRENAQTQERWIDQRLTVLQRELDKNIRQKPSSWLATKVFDGRMTFEQLQEQRRQIDKDITNTEAMRQDISEASIQKQFNNIDKELSGLESQLQHQEPILAELRRDLPNLKQIGSALSP